MEPEAIRAATGDVGGEEQRSGTGALSKEGGERIGLTGTEDGQRRDRNGEVTRKGQGVRLS